MAICSLFADSPIAIFYLKIRNFKALLGSLIITLEKGCFGLICSESKVGEGIVGLRTLSDGPLGLQGGSSLLTLLNISESFFRHTLAVIGYVAEVTKNLKNDSLTKNCQNVSQTS